MFKLPFLTHPLVTAFVGLTSLFTLSGSAPAEANVFSDIPIDSDRIIAIAAPYNRRLAPVASDSAGHRRQILLARSQSPHRASVR
jgi:hypothetical protein